MTGQTVRVTPPHQNTVDTLQGLASFDAERVSAQILAGGTVEDFTVTPKDSTPSTGPIA